MQGTEQDRRRILQARWAFYATKLLKERLVSISPGLAFGDYPAFFRLAVSLRKRQIPNAIRSIGKAVESW